MTSRNNKPIIEVKHLSKEYQIGMDRTYKRFTESFTNAVRHPVRTLRGLTGPKETFWALKDINFEVERGEVLGIIGRNGAGKSTLLKILSRITYPTEGEIVMRGRVGSLLEVGTGFHPELTGRENIYFNGAILGMKKREIEEKFEEIVKFSGVEKFLDTPVKRYSSGMNVRLAFSVAAHLDPEILLVDEVLAVGDAEFQKKCLGKMGEVASEGRTVLFVSHNMGAIKTLTKRVIVLDKGMTSFNGETSLGIQKYMSNVSVGGTLWHAKQVSNNPIQILKAEISSEKFKTSDIFCVCDDLYISVDYEVREKITGVAVAVIIHASDGALLFSTEDTDSQLNPLDCRLPGHYHAIVKIPGHLLNSGDYYVRVGCGSRNENFDNVEALRFRLVETRNHLISGYRNSAYFLPMLDWNTELIQN